MKTSQNNRVKDRLEEGWLSSVEAVREMFILRLASRIVDLRKMGHDIEVRTVEGKTYSEYRIKPEREQQTLV